jgi:glucan endo-1,3-alpha-glucosidase
MTLAKNMGIDAFALNIGNLHLQSLSDALTSLPSGKDDFNDQQLTLAYTAAQTTGFKVFISFDFAFFTQNGEHYFTYIM